MHSFSRDNAQLSLINHKPTPVPWGPLCLCLYMEFIWTLNSYSSSKAYPNACFIDWIKWYMCVCLPPPVTIAGCVEREQRICPTSLRWKLYITLVCVCECCGQWVRGPEGSSIFFSGWHLCNLNMKQNRGTKGLLQNVCACVRERYNCYKVQFNVITTGRQCCYSVQLHCDLTLDL